MREVKKINIKSVHYYFDDIIDIRNFHSNLLKTGKKSHRDINIYYIAYITIKKVVDCENIHSMNLLYFVFIIIHSATGHFKLKNDEKYLILDSTEKYEEVFLELDQRLKRSMVEKNCFMKKAILELELILMMIYL